MYRIKAPKNGAWVPILANPDIVLEYNQNVVTTLHAKNLLLLGEDRFLSTLMLRTFPKRQMMFVPQAVCKTVVPNTFSVLLSQRRRWINSTVHNLMELVMVSDLCGIACLSMQFVVTIDLIGTIVLPAAICFTIYLIVITCVNYKNPQFQALFLLAAILGLPALLIVITTRKVVYIGWMVVSVNRHVNGTYAASFRAHIHYHRSILWPFPFGTLYFQFIRSGILMISPGVKHARWLEKRRKDMVLLTVNLILHKLP